MHEWATAEITAILELDPGVRCEPDDTLEVALDCPACGRTGRTMIFDMDQSYAICTPTGHQVPGRILDRQWTADGATMRVCYRITYPTGSFMDPQRHYPAVPHPTWGRVKIRLTCPACQAVMDSSTQNNLGRPRRCRCACGQVLLVENTEMPMFRLIDIDDQTLYEQTVSMYTVWLAQSSATAPLVEALAALLGTDIATINERVSQQQPIFAHSAFGIKDPIWFSTTLREIVFLLLRSGAAFDVTGYGRSLKPSYEQDLLQQSKDTDMATESEQGASDGP